METKQLDPIGSEVRAGLARLRLSQADLGKHLNLSRTAVQRRLNGDVPFNIPELRATAALIGIPAADLLALPSPLVERAS